MSSSGVTGGGRVIWLDVARGACVIAVVLLHVRIFVYEPMLPAGVEGSGWRRFTEFFGPFRLPLLFAISGLLVSERVRRGWRDRRNAARVASSYWLYLVWLCAFAVMSAAVLGTGARGVPFAIHSPADFVQQLWLPDTTLWFVFALAVYVVVLTSLSPLPAPAVLGLFAAVAVLSGLAPASEVEAQWLHIVYFSVFFAVGVYLPVTLGWFARGRVAVKLVIAAALFTALLLLWQLTEVGDIVESTARLARDLAAIGLAIAVCALLSRVSPLARPLAAVGRQTVPVYILQLPLIWVLYLVPVVWELHRSPLTWAVGPVVGTAVVVLASLGVYRLANRGVLRGLFRLPPAIGDRIVRR